MTKRNSWRRSVTDRHLISADELRAAGALDVPPSWRKSLAKERDSAQRTLFDDIPDEETEDEEDD
jgi:hypothetical protein